MARKHTFNVSFGACIVASIFASTQLNAKSVTVTGEIETRAPVVVASMPKPQVEAYVEPVAVTLSEGPNSGCTLTTNHEDAKAATNQEELVCAYDVSAPYSMEKVSQNSNKELLLTGILEKEGDTILPVSTVFYSGSANTPVQISTQSVTLNAIAPIPLTIENIDYKSKQSTGVGDLYEINTPDANHSITINVQTNQKDYERKIVADGYTECKVAASTNEPCELDFRQFEFGSEEDRYGEKTINLFADSHNDYFLGNEVNVVHPVTIRWDSRLPELVGFATGDFPEKGNNTVETTEGVFTAEKGQWVLVVKTPHYARTDDWWHLNAIAKISPVSDVFKPAPDVEINGMNYRYLWNTRSTPSSGSLSVSKVELVGEYYKFYFDTRYVEDASYTVDFTIFDTLGNKIAVNESVDIENVGYEKLFFINNKEYSENTSRLYPAYFPQDLKFAIFSRFRNLTIDTVKINGSEVTYEDVNGNGVVYQVTSFPETLQSNDEAELELTVSDDLGNSYVDTAKFSMQPFSTDLRYKEAFQNVQKYSVDITQNKSGSGTRECVFYDDEERAKTSKFEYSSQLHCYLEFIDLDGSMTPVGLSRLVRLSGFPDKENANPVYTYRTHFFNHEGLSSVSAPKTIDLTSLSVPEIKLSIQNGEVIEGDEQQAFAVPIDGGQVAEVRASMVNAGGKIVADNPLGEDVIVNISQTGYSTSYEPRSYFRVYTDPGKLWEQAYLTVKAGYDSDSGHDIVKQISMVYVPNSNIKAYIDTSSATTVNTEPYNMLVGVGVVNKDTDSYDYDKATHGEWDLQLQKRLETKEYVNVGDSIRLPDSGQYAFPIDTSGLEGSKSYRYRVVASIVSDYPGYSKSITSRDMTLRVNKGGPVLFDYESKGSEGVTPYKYKAKILIGEKADKRAWGHTNWYVKRDGGSWNLIEGTQGRSLSYELTQGGNYQVKAEVVNKYTGAKSEKVSENILVYDSLDFELKYNSTEYVGLKNIIEAIPSDASKEYDVLWSLDNCATFVPGELKYEFVVAEPQKLKVCAKLAEKGTEQAGDSRWVMQRVSITNKNIVPLDIRSYTSKTSEVGFSTELKAQIRVDKGIRHSVEASWYSPTGEKIDSTLTQERDDRYVLTATYIVKPEDLAANRQTKPFFIEGKLVDVLGSEYRADSVMEVLYYEFPEWNITMKQDYLYAPTTATVYANMVKVPEVDMKFKFEWLTRDGVSLVDTRNQDNKGRGYYEIKEAGNREFAVLISDERGNEKLYTIDSVSEVPDPAELKLKVYESNSEKRYPLDILLRPYVTYSHRKDGVEKSTWYVNGKEELAEEGSNKLFYTATEAGDYTFRYVVHSELGSVDEISQTITVVPNKLPVCKIETREKTSNVQFTADCDDEDGKVQSYQFEFPELGITASSKDYILSYSKIGDLSQVTVKLTATDDSNESVTEQIVYQVPKSEDES